MTLPCPACKHPVDIEGLCRNLDCPEMARDSTPVTVARLTKVLTRMRDVMVAERVVTEDDAKTLAHAFEDLFTRMKAYADSDPLRSCWVSGYVEGYAMKLGELIHEHREESPVVTHFFANGKGACGSEAAYKDHGPVDCQACLAAIQEAVALRNEAGALTSVNASFASVDQGGGPTSPTTTGGYTVPLAFSATPRTVSCTCSIGDSDRFGASPTCDVHGLGARCPTCDQALNSAGVCPACGKRP